MALMLMQREATVSVCHVKTRDLAQFTILADILVVAAGKPNLILPQMVKSGAVVIDVGINRLPDGRIVGDVDFEGVRQKASYITPVPGGVGPMTVTMLADILVVAAGVPGLIVPQMVRTGAVVIDVGINRLPDGRIVGDVEFEGVREKASAITPVPGGVGPMTIAMLLYNTVQSAERSVAG